MSLFWRLLFFSVLLRSRFVISSDDLQGEFNGILVWFYTIGVVEGETAAMMRTFNQTAGSSYPPFHVIHEAFPLSPQSALSQDLHSTLWLELAPDEIVIRSERTLFLGEVLNITKRGNSFKNLTEEDNVLLTELNFDSSFDPYLEDSPLLLLNDPVVVEARDNLIYNNNTRILDYIQAMSQWVQDLLHYEYPPRPSTAAQIMELGYGYCGEFALVKMALLRSAGIPSRYVYATRTVTYGPSWGSDDSHVWLQAFIPEAGWVAVPSTRNIPSEGLLAFQGGYFPEGYFIRAIYPDTIAQTWWSSPQQWFSRRGNGMFLDVPPGRLQELKELLSDILDYDTTPNDIGVFSEIEELLPLHSRPLIYWFMISVPEPMIHKMASDKFVESLDQNPQLQLDSFLRISPPLVVERIESTLSNAKSSHLWFSFLFSSFLLVS